MLHSTKLPNSNKHAQFNSTSKDASHNGGRKLRASEKYTNPRREWHNNAGAVRRTTRMRGTPLVPRDTKAALPGALTPQQLLSGEVALLEPPTVRRGEEQLLASLGEVEGEHFPVERAIGAVQEGHPPVIRTEAERRRRLVARQRVLHDLLDRHAAALDARCALRAADRHSDRKGHPSPQARLLAVVLFRPLRPRRVDRSHRPRGSRRGLYWGAALAETSRKMRSFRRIPGKTGSSTGRSAGGGSPVARGAAGELRRWRGRRSEAAALGWGWVGLPWGLSS
jgi:hypothetical protein